MTRLFLLVLMAMVATPAVAASTGDMFGDRGSMIINRPPVESDRFYAYTSQADMFGTPTPYMRASKDVFDNVSPPEFGSTDMFRPTVPFIPDQPLYHWPKDAPYP